MKKALATIDTEIGTMTICYNGPGEAMTAEDEGRNVSEDIEAIPQSYDDATDIVYALYGSTGDWHLTWIDAGEPTYYLPADDVNPDAIYGGEEVTCLTAAEVDRLSREWDTNLWDQMRVASQAEVERYGIGDGMTANLMDIMVQDWLAENADEMEDLVLDGEPFYSTDLRHWVQLCHDENTDYTLDAEGGEIHINYAGTR